MKTVWPIARCLIVVCLAAGVVLGVAYVATEPTRRTNAAAMETAVVRRLLALPADARVTEVRRYLCDAQRTASPLMSEHPRLSIGYLLPEGLELFDRDGRFLRTIPRPAAMREASAEVLDRWVAGQLIETRYVGRFFLADGVEGAPIGYVTEGTQYGFKSSIRFFVALSADFRIRGVEVVAHEEDPGLGAEIARPAFTAQFIGRTAAALAQLKVVKGSLQPRSGGEGGTRSALPSGGATRAPETDPRPAIAPAEIDSEPIYAVTGATISSAALADGVKRSVAHVARRLAIVRQKAGQP